MINRHKVSLVKQNGIRKENINAEVQPTEIFITVKGNNDLPPIESGDYIEHLQSNGITEKYEVLDPCFYDDSYFGEHYQCRVRKLSAKEKQNTQHIYNINATQANFASNNSTINAVQNIEP